MSVLDSFFDEVEKIAVRLSDAEERRQALKFTGLGAVSFPVISGVANLVSSGRTIPKGVKPTRWIAGQSAAGAVSGGLLPSIRHNIERQTQDEARERLRAARR